MSHSHKSPRRLSDFLCISDDEIEFAQDDEAASIYRTIASVGKPLRPNTFILPNSPGYDDMPSDCNAGLCAYGEWVNGGVWTTCEARMLIGCLLSAILMSSKTVSRHIPP